MKRIQWIFILLFSFVLLVPLVTFNFEKNSVSAIDNRMLTEDVFHMEGDLTANIESYVNDRIGFRDKMILSYTVLNDRIFHKMVHPNYVYGTDGYVFGAGLTVNAPYTEYHEVFADMVKEIQTYCEERDVPFLFVFNPAKPAVLTDYLPKGIDYDRQWVDGFMAALDKRDIRYIDNTVVLREKNEAGETVFNQKYDANHWNDMGAYYGSSAMLVELQKDFPEILICEQENLNIEEELMTSLPVSEFPIEEYVPKVTFDIDLDSELTDYFDEELERHPSYMGFSYIVNEDRKEDGAPKTLVFQGSYMNSLGSKYLSNGLGEYIAVHDYQNVIEFPYYFNIFQPECVIFEVAEYTFSDEYFDSVQMATMDLNPVLEDVEAQAEHIEMYALENIEVEQGNALTKIYWQNPSVLGNVWLSLDKNYDMKKTETCYTVTIPTEIYESYGKLMKISVWNGTDLFRYE